MRPHRRTGPFDHLLVVADVEELDAIRTLLLLAPETAYGQVLVETDEGRPLPEITAPGRVTVQRVVRPDGAPPGTAVTAAALAWVAEWMPQEHDPARELAIYVGTCLLTEVPPLSGRLERL